MCTIRCREGSLEAASVGPEETSQSGHISDDGSSAGGDCRAWVTWLVTLAALASQSDTAGPIAARVHNPFTIAVESE